MYPGVEKEYYMRSAQAQTTKSINDTVSSVVPRLLSLSAELANGNNAIAESLRGGIPEPGQSLSEPVSEGLVGTLIQIERYLVKANNLSQEAHSILN